MTKKKKMPSIFTMAKNFAKDLGTYIKEGAPNVSNKQYTERLEACNKCPNLDKKSMRCTLCGCAIEHKAKWKTTICPDKPARWIPLYKDLKTPKSEKSRKAIATNKLLRKAAKKGIWDPQNPETVNPLLKRLGYDNIKFSYGGREEKKEDGGKEEKTKGKDKDNT
mgnify:FL=1